MGTAGWRLQQLSRREAGDEVTDKKVQGAYAGPSPALLGLTNTYTNGRRAAHSLQSPHVC